MRLRTCVGYTLPYEIGGTQKSKVLVALQANIFYYKVNEIHLNPQQHIILQEQ